MGIHLHLHRENTCREFCTYPALGHIVYLCIGVCPGNYTIALDQTRQRDKSVERTFYKDAGDLVILGQDHCGQGDQAWMVASRVLALCKLPNCQYLCAKILVHA